MKFACQGDIGNGSVSLRNHSNVERPELDVSIDLSEPVALTFSLKYLVNFCKASGLSGSVKLCLSNEVPLLVEYELASNSFLRFYLAPKVCFSCPSVYAHADLPNPRSETKNRHEEDYCDGKLFKNSVGGSRSRGNPRLDWFTRKHHNAATGNNIKTFMYTIEEIVRG